MSAPAFAWAMEQGRRLKLPVAERMLLIAIAERFNPTVGYAFPGQETLAADTGLTARTVRDLAPQLAKRGLIRIEKVGRTLHYHIIRANGLDPEPAEHRKPVPVSAAENRKPVPVSTSTPEIASAITPEASSSMAPGKPEASSGIQADTGNSPLEYRKPVPTNLSINQEREERKKEPPKPPASGGRDRASYPTDFDAFWLAYPRKAAKRAALKGWAGAVARAGGAAAIMAGLASHRFAAEERFIPHPSTWLNRDQWLDEQDSFDPVLRAVGLTPEDFAVWPMPEGRLLQ